METIKIVFNTSGNIEKLQKMIKELTELGVYNSEKCVIEYDETNKELVRQIKTITEKYLHKVYHIQN